VRNRWSLQTLDSSRSISGLLCIRVLLDRFTDVNIEHEYQVLHTHSSSLSCGSQPAAKAWFYFLDGVKFVCFGFQAYISGSSAPHAFEGDSFMEANDAAFNKIIAYHHYLSDMKYSRTGAIDGSGWSTTNFDAIEITPSSPASGHGDTVTPRDWFHACFNQTCSS
jgi:hypothetical protein